MERRRLEEVDEEALQEFRCGWCLGGDAFRGECLEQMEGRVGENHPGEMKQETAEAKAGRLILEELARLNWAENELAMRRKSDPSKLAMAARLRREATLSIKQIAERLHLDKPRGAKSNPHRWLNQPPTNDSPGHLGI